MSLDEEDDIIPSNKTSRRNFLKGAVAGGVIAAVVVAGAAELTVLSTKKSSSSSTTPTTSQSTTQTGTVTTTTAPTLGTTSSIALTINGKSYGLVVDNRWSLADTLKYKLNLIGTKQGCNRGECGACAVLVDGVSMLACTMLAVESVGHAITTIEGIGVPGNLSKLQGALLDADGVQCGYCMPGIVVTATELLNNNPTPTAAQIMAALAGNICRCQNWPHILAGVQAVA